MAVLEVSAAEIPYFCSVIFREEIYDKPIEIVPINTHKKVISVIQLKFTIPINTHICGAINNQCKVCQLAD